jgi:serine/threonine-protein phosphatase 2B regulatory subunit
LSSLELPNPPPPHLTYTLLLHTCAGLVTFDDMQIMLRQLAGSTLSDEDINTLVRRALTEAGSPQGLTLQAFKQTLPATELAGMVVEVPTEL